MTTAQFGLAQPVRRVEDPRLLKGQGRYIDDIVLPGMLHGVVLRSPYAAATIRGVDASAARSLPGVHAIYTTAELKADAIGTLPCVTPPVSRCLISRRVGPRVMLAFRPPACARSRQAAARPNALPVPK